MSADRKVTKRYRRKRPKRYTETRDFISAARRFIRAAGPRVAYQDPDDLAALAALRDVLDEAIVEGMAGQRRAGITWAHIAEAMGTSKQNVVQRWSKKVDAYEVERARREELEALARVEEEMRRLEYEEALEGAYFSTGWPA